MINLNEVAEEIREILEQKRNEYELSFIEDDHIYFMRDVDGKYRNDFPSVSKVLKKFYDEFPAEEIAYNKAKGDRVETQRLCDLGQITKGDSMINAGKKYLNLSEQRNLVLLDTEIVLGHPELGYVGQPDKVWLTLNASGDGFGLLITDWKTNKEKNFKVNDFTKSMHSPFENYPSTALGHYYLQLPFYGKLLLKMLEGTKYGNMKLLGCIVVLLKDNSEYEEFRVPKEVINKILEMDMGLYLK